MTGVTTRKRAIIWCPAKVGIGRAYLGCRIRQAQCAGVYRKTTAYTGGLNYYIYGHNLKFQTDYSFLDNDSFQRPAQGAR